MRVKSSASASIAVPFIVKERPPKEAGKVTVPLFTTIPPDKATRPEKVVEAVQEFELAKFIFQSVILVLPS